MAEPAQQYTPEDSPYDDNQSEQSITRPNLRASEGGGESTPRETGHLHTVDGNDSKRDDGGESKTKSKSLSPTALSGAEAEATKEESSTSSTKSRGSSLYREEGKRSSLLFGLGSRTKGSSSKRKKKILIGVGLGGGGGVLVVLVGLLFLATSLKIPDLAQHITEFEFARLTRQFSQSADRVTEQDLSVEALDGGASGDTKGTAYDSVKGKYQNLRDSTWGKLDKYRPSKVIQNLETDNGLTLNTTNTITGRTVLQSVELDGETYQMAQTSGFKRFVPLIKQFSDFKNQVTFSRDFAPDLIDAMRANNIGTIVRSATAKDLRDKLGIGLVAWTVAKFQGKTPPEASLELDREAYGDINEGGFDQSTLDEINKASQDSQNQIKTDVGSDSALKEIEDNGGSDTAANAVIESDVGQGALNGVAQKIIGFANPIYAAAVPACIIYDGSLNSSGSTIDAQTAEQQRAFYYVAKSADQQKYGTEPNDAQDGLATAVGATNTKIGDITQSNPEIRAGGGTVDTSATTLSAEASPTGNYTLFNAIPGIGSSGAASTISSIASKACGPLTNLWDAAGLGVALAVAQLVADVFTGGGASAGDAAADAAIDTAADDASQSIVSRLTTALSEKFEGTFTKNSDNFIMKKIRDNVGKEVGKVTGLVGLTVLAKLIVLEKSHQLYNGLEQGADFDNEADSGGNIQAGELERTELFGRPMMKNEVCASDQQDVASVKNQAQQNSAFQRYFATSNADSLLSRTAITVSGNFNGSLPSLFMRISSDIFKPSSLISSVASLFSHGVSAAQCPNDDAGDYGNVQFGWSQDEENLVDSTSTYLQLENQQTLDNAAKIQGQDAEDFIASTYAICFGYKYTASSGGSLDPTDSNSELQLDDGTGGSASLGTLLANGDITRDTNGNVIASQGLCSPQNLGPNNPQYGDLVFRWRLAMQYDITLNQLTQEANLGSS